MRSLSLSLSLSLSHTHTRMHTHTHTHMHMHIFFLHPTDLTSPHLTSPHQSKPNPTQNNLPCAHKGPTHKAKQLRLSLARRIPLTWAACSKSTAAPSLQGRCGVASLEPAASPNHRCQQQCPPRQCGNGLMTTAGGGTLLTATQTLWSKRHTVQCRRRQPLHAAPSTPTGKPTLLI